MSKTLKSSQEMLLVGRQCAECRRHDFLPFVCSKCGRTYCEEHLGAHSGCAGDVLVDRVVPNCPLCGALIVVAPGQTADDAVARHIDAGCAPPAPPQKLRHACTKPGCSGSEAVEVICPRCGKNFCFRHRFPEDHNCPALRHTAAAAASPQQSSSPKAVAAGAASSQSVAAAAARVEELRKAAAAKQGSLWRRVELMRAKARAVGDAKVPSERRVFFEVVFPMSSGTAPQNMFFDERWTVGKVLDKVADAGGVSNRNAVPGAPKLVLVALTSGKQLTPSKTLQELVADSTLKPGDPVLLETEDALAQQ